MPHNVGPRSCQDVLYDHATNPNAHLWYKSKNTNFLDKGLKTLVPSLKLTGLVIEHLGGPKEATEGCYMGAEWGGTGRDAIAAFNACRGAPAAVPEQAVVISRLVRSLIQDDQQPVSLRLKGKLYSSLSEVEDKGRIAFMTPLKITTEDNRTVLMYGNFNEYAITTSEKIVMLFVFVGKIIGAVTFVLGFAVFRLLGNIDKHVFKPLKLQMDPKAKELAKMFPLAMLINHIAGIVEHIFSLIQLHMMWNREVSTGRVLDAKVWEEREHRIKVNIAGAIEKILELFSDGLVLAEHVIGPSTPIGVRIANAILNIVIGGTGLYKEHLNPN
jgi:hypothetical protein